MNSLVSLYCHWGARLGATAAVFSVIVFLIGQGVPDRGALERTEGILWAWFFLTLVGLATIWRWETNWRWSRSPLRLASRRVIRLVWRRHVKLRRSSSAKRPGPSCHERPVVLRNR